jgi:hypothetical protein
VLEELTRPLYARRYSRRLDTSWEAPMAKAVAKWMRESGRRDASAFETTISLYLSWRAWCSAQDMQPGSPPRFCKIVGRVLKHERHKVGRSFAGFKLGERAG